MWLLLCAACAISKGVRWHEMSADADSRVECVAGIDFGGNFRTSMGSRHESSVAKRICRCPSVRVEMAQKAAIRRLGVSRQPGEEKVI